MKKEIYLTFTMEDGTIYTANDATYAYCYKQTPTGFKTRVSKIAVLKAHEEYKASEWGKAELEAKQKAKEEAEKSDKAAEKKVNKQSKPRKSKNVAFSTTIALADDKIADVTLTQKQVDFIKNIPNDDFYENGLDSAIWNDVYCDTVAGIFSPMAVGAMISTLKEKGLIVVGKGEVNGKRANYFEFTDLGKEVAKELGLE